MADTPGVNNGNEPNPATTKRKSFLTAIAEAKAPEQAAPTSTPAEDELDFGPTEPSTSYSEETAAKLAAFRAKLGLTKPLGITSTQPAPAQPALPTGLEDFADSTRQYDNSSKDYINGLSAEQALQMLTVKEPKPHTQGTETQFRCPWPEHVDNEPSASINKAKKVWDCYACGGGGGDWVALGAAARGYTSAGSKVSTLSSSEFQRLMKELEDLSGWTAAHPPVAVPPSVPTPPAVVVADDPQPATAPDPTPAPEDVSSRLDWRAVLALSPANRDGNTTFIQEYCRAASKDTVPEEFHLFSALTAVGLVAGWDVTSTDVLDLTANFGVCFVARSGAGKSRGTYHLTNVIKDVWPGHNNGTGIQIPDTVYSGQSLVSSLVMREEDPIQPGLVWSFPVRALFEYGELSSLMSGGGIQGSILKDKIHEVLDAKKEIQYKSQTSGRIVAKDPFASIITTTQTKRVRDLLKKSDQASGFMNRFLFIFGTEKPQLARGKVGIDMSTAKAELTAVKTYAAGKKKVLDWSDDADAHWEKVFRSRVEPLQKVDTHDILTRLDLNLKRMILAFAINEKSSRVERHHVEMAEALIDYLVVCYGAVVGAMLNTEDGELANWLIEKIQTLEQLNLKKSPENYGPTQAELRRYYKQKGYDDTQVNRSLKELMTAGLVFKQPAQGKRGRTTDRYYAQDFD